jgi:hypothetical protein
MVKRRRLVNRRRTWVSITDPGRLFRFTVLEVRSQHMLETVAVVLVLLWALGLVGGYALGGLIHVLLVLALVVVIVRVIQGRRVV